MATVDILVAKSDIAMGQADSPAICNGRPGRPAPPSGNFIRKTDQPDAIESLAGNIARAPFVCRRADPRSQARQRQRLRLHGGDPAVRHARGLHANLGGNRRRRIHSAQRSRRRDPDAPRHGGGKGKTGTEVHVSETILATCACWRSTRPSGKGPQKVVVGKTATLELAPKPGGNPGVAQQLGTMSLALRSITDASKRRSGSRTKPRGNRPGRGQRGSLWREHDDDAEMMHRGEPGTCRARR